MPSFAAQHSLFRAYDIRGARQYFTPDFIHALGETFAQLYRSQNQTNNIDKHHSNCAPSITVVIGYDVRGGSDAIAQVLADRLSKQHIHVIDLGLITTPMMAFWAQQYDGHGIMVTASHSAKDILGVKWLVDHTSPSSQDIARLYENVAACDTDIAHCLSSCAKPYSEHQTKHDSTNQIIHLPADTVANTYMQAMTQVFARLHPHEPQYTPSGIEDTAAANTPTTLNMTVVIDCLNGATCRIAKPLFERFCTRVIMLNDLPDGNFPAGNPDPTERGRLAELQQTVIITQADIGIAFDGDGDRVMIVDNSGKVVMPDHLLYLLAHVALVERPPASCAKSAYDDYHNQAAPQVIFDIKCAHHLSPLLSKLGAQPIMSKTGSSLMRKQLQTGQQQAIFAGELSGHFIFNDGYFIVYDDAIYASLRLLHWLAHTAAVDMNLTGSGATQIPNSRTDVWGARKSTTAPIQLTDITQTLPTLISTADHYLPIPTLMSTDCSIVQHLTELCHYLQHQVAILPQTTAQALPDCLCLAAAQRNMGAQAHDLLPAGTQVTCLDGVRLDFAHGFGILRESNTSHSLTVRFAGDSVSDLQDIQTRFVTLCRPFNAQLAAQIADIAMV